MLEHYYFIHYTSKVQNSEKSNFSNLMRASIQQNSSKTLQPRNAHLHQKIINILFQITWLTFMLSKTPTNYFVLYNLCKTFLGSGLAMASDLCWVSIPSKSNNVSLSSAVPIPHLGLTLSLCVTIHNPQGKTGGREWSFCPIFPWGWTQLHVGQRTLRRNYLG